MAMMTGGSSGNRFGRGRYRPTAEINITPFVDVMLVLLIIFMVAAPLLTVTVPVDLSPSSTGEPVEEQEPLAVTVASDGRVYLKDQEIQIEGLVGAIQQAANGNMEQRIYVRGDRTVNYERVMQVMSTINGAGFHRIGLMGMAAK